MELLKSSIDNVSLMTPIIFVEDSVYKRYTSCYNYAEEHEEVKENEHVEEVKENEHVKEVKENEEHVEEVKEKLNPIEFLKASLNMIDCDNAKVIEIIYKFCEEDRVVHKFKRKNISMIAEGIANNKWNIYVCNLFHFLLGRNFLYRNKIIGDSDIDVYKI